MKKHIGLIGPITLGLAVATVGLSGVLAVPQSVYAVEHEIGDDDGDHHGTVPEPSTLIFLGAALAGLWIWKRKSTKI